MTDFRRFLCLTFGIALLALPAWGSHSTDTYVFRTLLSPANEVPPVAIDASGVALVFVHVVRDARGQITGGTVDFQVDYRFPGEVELTGLHIHPGVAGVNGPVTVSSGLAATQSAATGSIFRSVAVPASLTAAFDTLVGVLNNPGAYYVNLHTRVNPGGVIRGQLQPADVLFLRGRMLPGNEVPAITNLDADASANIVVYATRDGNGAITSGSVLFDVGFRHPEAVDITGLHIHHPGAAGVNAPVRINPNVARFSHPGGSARITRMATVEPTNADGLAAMETLFRDPSQAYVNLHTSVWPGGAVRAQLERTEAITFRTHLSPDNEVPPVTGVSAAGAHKLTLHVTRDSSGQITAGTVVFDSSVEFPSPVEFTGFHVHQSPAGVNGGVVIDSGLSGTNRASSDSGNVYRIVDIGETNTNAVNALRGLVGDPSGFYTNMHTPENPGGVIRGQLAMPGEPDLQLTLDPGYYVVEVTTASGQPGGFWGMVAATNGAFSGGFNLGGGLGVNGLPGFGAFVLHEPRSVTLNLNAQALPGEAGPQVRMRLLSGGDPVTGTSSATLSRTLQAGFHVVEILNTAGAGTFQLRMDAGVLRDGAIAGGFVGPGIVGFGAFNVGARQTVTIRLFGKNFYTPFGAGNLAVAVKNHATGVVFGRAQ